MNEIEIEVDKELEEKELKAVEGSDEKPKLEKAELLGIKFVTTKKGADLLNDISRVFDLVDVKQDDSKSELQKCSNDELQNAENRIRNTIETKDLTFIDGVLVTWEIFNNILDKRLRDDNGDPEGIIYKGKKYDYLGIINDDITDLLLNKVLEQGYFKNRGKQLSNQFGINIT